MASLVPVHVLACKFEFLGIECIMKLKMPLVTRLSGVIISAWRAKQPCKSLLGQDLIFVQRERRSNQTTVHGHE